MKQITVRNLPPQVEKAIREESRRRKMSINKTVAEMLRRAAGAGEEKPGGTLYHDLDELSGVWSPKEAEEFAESLARQRQIDEELWR